MKIEYHFLNVRIAGLLIHSVASSHSCSRESGSLDAAKGQEDPTGWEPNLEHAKGVSRGVLAGTDTDHPCLEVSQLHGRKVQPLCPGA